MSQKLPNPPNLRADSAWIIYQILEGGKSSRECLTLIQQRHNPRDNAWIQEMSMGVLRQLPLLQSWLRPLLSKPLKGKKKIVEHLLLLGIYQLAFSRVSPHAAVAETVNAVTCTGSGALKGLVNAVLRNFQRSGVADNPVTDPILASGLPKWLFNAINQSYRPDESAQIIAQTNTIAPLWLRVNQQQVSRDEFTSALEEQQLEYELPPNHPDAVILRTRKDIPSLPGFDKGWFAVQDGAAQLAAGYLGAQPEERILDCCAAPGGKTGHILERQPRVSACVALDNDSSRLTRVVENMQRLGHQAIVVEGDAAQPDNWWDGDKFDRILLDAPCSATGVIRRHPDIRWLRQASDIQSLVDLQWQILNALWPLLKPDGVLLYATCSILEQENKQQIVRFLAQQADARLYPFSLQETPASPGRQILPGEEQMDGFYYARLIKSSDSSPTRT